MSVTAFQQKCPAAGGPEECPHIGAKILGPAPASCSPCVYCGTSMITRVQPQEGFKFVGPRLRRGMIWIQEGHAARRRFHIGEKVRMPSKHVPHRHVILSSVHIGKQEENSVNAPALFGAELRSKDLVCGHPVLQNLPARCRSEAVILAHARYGEIANKARVDDQLIEFAGIPARCIGKELLLRS